MYSELLFVDHVTLFQLVKEIVSQLSLLPHTQDPTALNLMDRRRRLHSYRHYKVIGTDLVLQADLISRIVAVNVTCSVVQVVHGWVEAEAAALIIVECCLAATILAYARVNPHPDTTGVEYEVQWLLF